MSGLRNLVDKLKPTFSEGGKLSFLGIDLRCVRDVPFRTEHHDAEGCAHP